MMKGLLDATIPETEIESNNYDSDSDENINSDHILHQFFTTNKSDNFEEKINEEL